MNALSLLSKHTVFPIALSSILSPPFDSPIAQNHTWHDFIRISLELSTLELVKGLLLHSEEVIVHLFSFFLSNVCEGWEHLPLVEVSLPSPWERGLREGTVVVSCIEAWRAFGESRQLSLSPFNFTFGLFSHNSLRPLDLKHALRRVDQLSHRSSRPFGVFSDTVQSICVEKTLV